MMYRNSLKPHLVLITLAGLFAANLSAKNLLDPANGGEIVYVNNQANNTTLAATNLIDNNFSNYWQSPSFMFGNDVNFKFGPSSPLQCFDNFSVTSFNNSTGLEAFMLLTTNDLGLDQDNGTSGWTPVVADPSPSGVINHLHWGQGGRLVSAPGSNPQRIHDGTPGNYWQSTSFSFNNTLEFAFDSDWNDFIGDAVQISELSLFNENNSTGVEKFQVEVKTLTNPNWTKLIASAAPVGDFNFLQSTEGGTLVASSGTNPQRIHDGTPGNYWQSASFAFVNNLEFEFDTDGDGSSGAAGDADDLFTLRQLNLFNENNSTGLEKFQVEVKTLANPNWTKLIASAAPVGDFNFLQSTEGGTLVASSGTNPQRIHDGTPGNYWQSASFAFVNDLDFMFDTDQDGTTGAAGDVDDLFTLRQINLYNENNSTGIQTFQIEVMTASNAVWTPVLFSGNTTITALRSSSKQIFIPDATQIDVTAVRLHTLTNYGNSLTRIREFEVIGDAVGPSHTFIAQRTGAQQSYVLDNPVVDVTDLRFTTLDNYGNSLTRVREFEVIGDAVGPSHTFIAQRTGVQQNFQLGVAVDNVTDVRLITLDNYGNSLTRIRDFGVLGTSSGPAYVFTAQRVSSLQNFNFAATSGRLFRFHSFDNFGNSLTRVREIALESTLCLAGSWSMDEITWNGSSDEIIDSSGNDHHGTAVNGAVPASTFSAIPGNPGTCGYGEFDGSNDYVALNNFPNLTGSFTITAWIRANSFNNDQRIFADDESNSGGFAFSLGDGGKSRLRFFSRNVSPVIVDTQTPAIKFDNQWYFVTAVHDAAAKTREIYVNGVAERLNTGGFISTYTGNWGEDNGTASIGGETNGAGSESVANWRFDGDIDEVRVYQQALDQTEIQAVMAETHPCSGGIDHFLISHDGQGISCAPEPVTVTAHAIDHSVFTGYASNIILDTGSGNGTWSLVSGNGSFSDATLDDGLANYQFDASDNGVAQFALDYQQGTSPINITVGDGSVLDDDTEGLLNFSPSGFIVTANQVSNPPPNPINDPVADQTAGTDFNMWITAFGQTATDPSCGVIESYAGVKPINFWNNTINPNTGTLTPTVAGSSIAASEGTSATQNITFNNGQAQITVKYKDVGQIRIDLKDADLVNKANVITGSSNNFVVKPADFVLSVSANPAAADANGAVFKKAGEAFQVDVSVVDAEGSVTPNYGNEITPETIKIKSSQLIAPVGGRNGGSGNGSLNNGTAFVATAPGQFSNTTLAFDEVGIIRLQADVGDEDYLASGNVTGAESGNVGRFIPDRFLVSDNSPQFRNGDSAWSCGFSYQQQPFEFDAGLNPIITITAVNDVGAPTYNYGADFWKLNTTAASRSYINQTAGIDAVLSSDISSATVTLSGTADLSDGQAQLSIAGDSLQYQKFAATPTLNDAPFAADAVLNLTVSDLQDTDSVCFDSDNDGACDEYQSSNITGTQIRWGRWSIQNVFGSELEALPIIAIAEQFDGSVFQVNTDDVCSATAASWIAPTLTNYTDNLADGETLLTQSAMLSGILPLSLSAPGEGNYGSTMLTIPTPNWMYYDFDGDGSADAASATATFGIFKGKSPVIYWRQKYSN